ncbi:hypothetical protein M406DRAFT_335292 [Cryphonectria parasitica EP155]|uniref:Uncharacterized protein n=1 Tax=Cryphonectria parasitica (strain ATCC 38755 / EP155) TaxID=660469 RepID=A0A9P4XQV4_CRYP1|nr:uncharacterized protein M406DRAFT_335292 [Cryphonectria parasitica EP155]KAF3760089.1 hypothetical protein M406DRAFT_335292 [Cryphonectria parasitica EP155]
MAQRDVLAPFHLQSLRNYAESYDAIRRGHLMPAASQRVSKHTGTQGKITDPEGRLAPERIEPWTDFLDEQRAIISMILRETAGDSAPLFPCRNHIQMVAEDLVCVDSEGALLLFDADTLHKPASRVSEALLSDATIRSTICDFQRANASSIAGVKRKRSADIREPTRRGPANVFCILEPKAQNAIMVNTSRPAGELIQDDIPRVLFLKEAEAPHKLTTEIINAAVGIHNDKVLESRTIMDYGLGRQDPVVAAGSLDADACEYCFYTGNSGSLSEGHRRRLGTSGSESYWADQTGAEGGSSPPSDQLAVVASAVAHSDAAQKDRGDGPTPGQDLGGSSGDLSSSQQFSAAADAQRPTLTSSASPTGQTTGRGSLSMPAYPSPPPPCDSAHLPRKRRTDEQRSPDGSEKRRRPGDTVAAPAPAALTSTPLWARPFCTPTCLRALTRLSDRRGDKGWSLDLGCPSYHDHACHPDTLTGAQFRQRLLVQLTTTPQGQQTTADSSYEFIYLTSGSGSFQGPDARAMRREARIYDRLRHLQGAQLPVCLGTNHLMPSCDL